MAAYYDFGSPEFDEAVRAAGHKAFLDTQAAGLPVFYLDDEAGANYEIICELTAHAA